ncbi:hypothetical protein ACXJY6_11770 [Vibrio sp. RC27]
MTVILEKATPLLKIIIYGAFFIGISFALIGVWLVYLGSTGLTELNLLGQSFESVNVGIGAVFIGGVVVSLTLRRAFQTIESGMNHAANEVQAKVARKQQQLSGKQLEFLIMIAEKGEGGAYACHLEEENKIGLSREDIVYRARDLESHGYISIKNLTDYQYNVTEKGLQELPN